MFVCTSHVKSVCECEAPAPRHGGRERSHRCPGAATEHLRAVQSVVVAAPAPHHEVHLNIYYQTPLLAMATNASVEMMYL